MLNRVIHWSLNHRLVVIVAWAGLALLGALAFTRLPMDAFPDTTPVQVQVNTVASALSPLEIERQVTAPVHGSLLLQAVRSLGGYGLPEGDDLHRHPERSEKGF